MRDNLPNMLKASAKEWRKENKVVATGATRYDVALEEAADAIEELTAYVALYKDGGETAMKVANDYKARIEELQGKADAYLHAMTYEHNMAARLLWDKEHCWIPVTERLPEFEGAVLCMRKSNVYGVRPHQEILYVDEYGFKNYDDIYLADGVVTHWMPLPEPPKEE